MKTLIYVLSLMLLISCADKTDRVRFHLLDAVSVKLPKFYTAHCSTAGFVSGVDVPDEGEIQYTVDVVCKNEKMEVYNGESGTKIDGLPVHIKLPESALKIAE